MTNYDLLLRSRQTKCFASQHIRCLEMLFYESTLTSRRQHRSTTRVAEALKHRIANQRDQHDDNCCYFRVINREKFCRIFLERREKKQGWGREREKNCEENARKMLHSFLVWENFLSACTLTKRDVNAAEETTELRENFHLKPFLHGGLRFGLQSADHAKWKHFVVFLRAAMVLVKESIRSHAETVEWIARRLS